MMSLILFCVFQYQQGSTFSQETISCNDAFIVSFWIFHMRAFLAKLMWIPFRSALCGPHAADCPPPITHCWSFLDFDLYATFSAKLRQTFYISDRSWSEWAPRRKSRRERQGIRIAERMYYNFQVGRSAQRKNAWRKRRGYPPPRCLIWIEFKYILRLTIGKSWARRF